MNLLHKYLLQYLRDITQFTWVSFFHLEHKISLLGAYLIYASYLFLIHGQIFIYFLICAYKFYSIHVRIIYFVQAFRFQFPSELLSFDEASITATFQSASDWWAPSRMKLLPDCFDKPDIWLKFFSSYFVQTLDVCFVVRCAPN